MAAAFIVQRIYSYFHKDGLSILSRMEPPQFPGRFTVSVIYQLLHDTLVKKFLLLRAVNGCQEAHFSGF
jgi:hypothetical protein